MRLLLLNNNPAVSRLIKLSTDKAGYELDEFDDFGLVPLSNYDVVLVDNELYDADAVIGLKEHTGCDYVIYICQRGAQKPEGVNVALEKPFLPTDFLTLLDKVKHVLNSLKVDEETHHDAQDDNASLKGFDIDNIDALEEDDEEESHFTLPIQEGEEDDDTSLSLEGMGLDDVMNEENEFDQEPLDDLSFDTLEEELSMPETHAAIKTAQDEVEDELPTSLEETLEEHTPCVLDKDDINEVKQLLDDSDDNEDELEIDQALASLEENDPEEKQFFFDDDKDETLETAALELPSLEDELMMDDDEISEMSVSVIDAPSADTEELQEEISHPQEDVIDSFEEALDECIAEEKEELTFSSDDEIEIPQVDEAMELPDSEEEILIPQIDVAMQDIPSEHSFIESLDDLNENLLKSAFGEPIDENIAESDVEAAPEKTEEIEVIRGEIENSIARSISGLAKSDILKEALKGMRINISITFDEK